MISKTNRLPKSVKYLTGSSLSNSNIRLIYQENNLRDHRYRVTISRKTQPIAVRRNLLRRRIYHLIPDFVSNQPPSDWIIIVSRSAFNLTYLQLGSNVSQLIPPTIK